MDAELSELLDDLLLERVLRGEPALRDVPTVATLMAALDVLRQAPLDDELAGEQAAVARFAAAYVPRPAVSPGRPGRWGRRSVRGLVIAGGLTMLSATAAAAATGTLPDPVQTLAADTLARVGVDVPRPEGQPADPASGPDERGTGQTSTGGTGTDGTATQDPGPDRTGGKRASGDAASPPGAGDAAGGAVEGTPTQGDPADAAEGAEGGAPVTNKGATISSIAQDPSLPGQEHGQAVSTEASDGHSQAGQHGAAARADATTTSTTDAAPPGNSGAQGPPEQAGGNASGGQGQGQGQGSRGRSAEAGAAGPVGSTTTTSTP